MAPQKQGLSNLLQYASLRRIGEGDRNLMKIGRFDEVDFKMPTEWNCIPF